MMFKQFSPSRQSLSRWFQSRHHIWVLSPAGVLSIAVISILLGIALVGGSVRRVLSAPQSVDSELTLAIKLNQQESAKLTRSESAKQRFDQLGDSVIERGRVRVIVTLRAAFSPEAELHGTVAARAQRAEIARVRESVIGSLNGYDQGSVRRFDFLPFFAASVNSTGLAALRNSADIIDIQEDKISRASLAESVPFIGGTNAWASGYTGSGQVVAILDTGVEKSHPMLSGKVVSEACYSTNDAAHSATSVCPGGVASSTAANSGLPCPTDCQHGTHVAGIAAGLNGSYSGKTFSGVAKDAGIIAIQVFTQFNTTGECGGAAPCVGAYDSDIISGLTRVYALRSTFTIAAANLSLGGGRSTSTCDASDAATKTVIDLLRSANIATVVASGNESYKDSISYPGCISTAISVGATYDTSNSVASFSNSASFLNLLAPGVSITSSIPGSTYATWNGTSMATPHVTGAFAVLKQKAPGASVSDLLTALSSTGVNVTDTNSITKPRIQLDAALAALSSAGAPSAPSSLVATTVSSTQIDLAWSDTSSNETGFTVQRKTGATGTWATVSTLTQNATTYQSGALTPGTTYYYRVYAFNANGQSLPSNEVNATTSAAPLNAPGNLSATAVSSTQINLIWLDNTTIETGFIIQRKSGSSGTWGNLTTVGANITSYQNTGLTAGTTYYYRIYATNGSTQSPASNEASATTTAIAAPSALVATAVSPTQINLAWTDNSSNETGFTIQRRTGSSGTWAILTSLGQNITSYQDAGLTAGTTYYYRLYATNSTNQSSNSNETNATTFSLAAPTGLSATAASSSQITLAWTDTTTTETGFTIQRKTGSSGSWATLITTAQNVTIYQNTGLSPGTSYTYRVFAASSSGQSAYSNEASATTLTLTAPSSLTATAFSADQINLGWTDTTSSETGFIIQRKTGSSGTWANLTTVGANVTAYQNTGLTPGTTYFYRVYATNGTTQSSASNEASATTNAIAAPSNLTATTVSPAQINLAWTDNSNNETGFVLQRKTGSTGTWTTLTTLGLNATSYQNTGLQAATTYYYRVYATATGSQSTSSNEANATTQPLPAPSSLKATVISASQINLSWTDNSTNETAFTIQRRTGTTGSWVSVTSVAANTVTYNNTGLVAGTTYYYRVFASSGTSQSTASSEASATTMAITAPTNLAATPFSATQIRLTWSDNSNNEANFIIERRTGTSTTWSTITTLAANTTSYLNSGLTAGTKYYYRVQGATLAGDLAPSNETNATTLAK